MGEGREKLLRDSEVDFVRAVAALAECNPFLPERLDLERRALGDAYVDVGAVWHLASDYVTPNPNTAHLRERLEPLAATLRDRLIQGARSDEYGRVAYRGLVFYLLWLRYEDDLWEIIDTSEAAREGDAPTVAWYERFEREAGELLDPLPGPPVDIPKLFALGFQYRRAFHHIFRMILGGSRPAAKLRANVWESIFTHDASCYQDFLFDRMRDFPVLITGETGTGKEFVARAIGLSQYVPFDRKQKRFVVNPATAFHPVNIAALSPTLIESELFGHAKGAFTGAVSDRSSWFESCGPHGTVFLDEIGELDATIQVKLLRVLQNREFYRVGERQPRRFEGRIVSATNRRLAREIRAGNFREDFFHRIAVDVIRPPTLRAQLADCPRDLGSLLMIVAEQAIGPTAAPDIAATAEDYIRTNLTEHIWPGNMRELEACVRSIIVHGEYHPRMLFVDEDDTDADLADVLRSGKLPPEDVRQLYVRMVYEETRNYKETARRLGIDWRTVRKMVGDDKKE